MQVVLTLGEIVEELVDVGFAHVGEVLMTLNAGRKNQYVEDVFW